MENILNAIICIDTFLLLSFLFPSYIMLLNVTAVRFATNCFKNELCASFDGGVII